MNEKEIKKILKDAGVPFAMESDVLDSIKWLICAYQTSVEREEYIENNIGISIIQNKANKIIPWKIDTQKVRKWLEIFDEN